MAHHLFIPLLLPLSGAALAVLFGRWQQISRVIIWLVAGLNGAYSCWLVWLTATAGRQVTQAGGWIAPFGITLAADMMSALMLCIAGLLMLATIAYSMASLDKAFEQFFYYPLLLLLQLGVNGAFITGDLFNLYVWFEVLLMASFGLLILGGTRGQLEGGLKYVVLNLIGSTGFLIGCGLIYGVAGTLNMAHLGERLATIQQPGLMTAIAGVLLFAFGSKAAIVPLFFWLPASYHTPTVPVTAIFSGLLTKVGIYSLYRVFGTVMQGELQRYAPWLLLLAGLTMVLGVFGAMAQMHIRRILSFHIVSQIGYALMGLGLAGSLGLSAGLLFLAHVMIVKSGLFFIGGAAEHIYGTDYIKNMGGLAKREPVLAAFWFLGILSLAGIPPMSGFFGKLALLQAGAAQGQVLITLIAAGVGILTFFSMLKIWNEVFWKKAYSADTTALPRVHAGLLAPGAVLVVLSAIMGIAAGPLLDYTQMAGIQVFDLTGYAVDVCGPMGCEAVSR
jgi:multicomponent Na+:H+ antiporter subunit D